MRVLHVVAAGELGGAERFLADLGRHADATGASHAVALFSPNPKLRPLFESLRIFDAGPTLDNAAGFLARTFGPRSTTYVKNAAREFGADLIHMHTLASHVLGVKAARALEIPSVRTEHHVVHYDDLSARAFTVWAAKRTDRIACVSNYVERGVRARQGGLAPKLLTIRNGIDVQRFTASAYPADGVQFRFAVACRLVKWKRVDWILHALHTLPSHVHLSIAGIGEELSTLLALTASLGLASRVQFLGFAADVAQVYERAQAVISSSEDEPLGLSVLEALACARPVVAFDGGGIPEIVQDGQSGFLAPEQTILSLAAAMRRAIETPKAQRAVMGEAGRHFAAASCDVRAMCTRYGALYTEMLARPARAS